MAFKDNIGVVEELIVQMVDCTSVTVDRAWLEELSGLLKGLRDPMAPPRQRLENVIELVEQKLQ